MKADKSADLDKQELVVHLKMRPEFEPWLAPDSGTADRSRPL